MFIEDLWHKPWYPASKSCCNPIYHPELHSLGYFTVVNKWHTTSLAKNKNTTLGYKLIVQEEIIIFKRSLMLHYLN